MERQCPEVPPGPGAIEAPTGAGRISATDPTTRFIQRRGYRLEQVSRPSELAMPELAMPEQGERFARLEREAAAAAGPGYRVHLLSGGDVTAEQREALAVLANG